MLSQTELTKVRHFLREVLSQTQTTIFEKARMTEKRKTLNRSVRTYSDKKRLLTRMSRDRLRPTRTISWQDEAIMILVRWIGNRLFDFFWGKIKTRLKFEGKTHFRHRIFVMFGNDLLMFILGWILYVPTEENTTSYREELSRFLKLHRRYHQLGGNRNRPCCVCLNINFFKPHFERYVSEPKLYPPFNF